MMTLLLRWLRYAGIGLAILLAVYALGRLVHVSLGSFYTGERGPYLQMLSDTAVTVRWQSADEYVGVVRYGDDPARLDRVLHERQAGRHHELRLSGLQPQTRYYYAIGNQQGGMSQPLSFHTAPVAGDDVPVRLWLTGDQGWANPVQNAVTEAAWDWLAQQSRAGRGAIDFWLTTGDNAYTSGTNEQFQENFFIPFENILRHYTVWPIYGNHDARRWAFFDIFSFPTRAEAGGVASGTEHYYSFDYGPLHVIVLDTQASNLSANARMANWLRTDLKATRQPWRLALFHHPPYTRGSHNSDNRLDSAGRLHKVREQLLPILERYGVDLVVSGHSHVYERSHAMACYYGESSSWQAEFVRDRQSPYAKDSGTMYMVMGSSARADHGPLDHPAMAVSLQQAGSVIIDIDGNGLTSRFINQDGVVADEFRIQQQPGQGTGTINCE